MAGFNLGAFAGAVGSGIEQGEDIRAKYRKLADEQRQRMAESVAGQVMAGGGQPPVSSPPFLPAGGAGEGPPGAMPGGPSPVGPPPGQPVPVQVPGAQPMPPGAMGGGGPPAPPQGNTAPPPTMGGGPPGGNAPPPAPAMGAAPGAQPGMPPPPPTAGPRPMAPPAAPMPPQGPPATGGTPAPGSNQDPTKGAMQQIMQQRQQNQQQIKSWYQQVLQVGGPAFKAHPEMAYEAVNMLIKQNKDLEDSDRTLLLAENKVLGDQISLMRVYQGGVNAAGHDATSAENTQTRVGAQERGQDMRSATSANSLAERVRNDNMVNRTAQQRAATYQEMATLSHEDRQAVIQAANERASQAVGSRERLAAQHEAAAMQRLDEALAQKDWATVNQIVAGEYRAQAGNAEAGKAPKPPAVTPAPGRGGGQAATSTPPVSALREGHDTTFANGQVWTLKAGKPVQVK